MDLRVQTSLLASVVCLALAASVALRSRKRRDQWLFAVFGLNMSLWYLTTFLSKLLTSSVWDRANLAFGVLLPLSTVEFFRTFMAEGAKGTQRLQRASWVAAAAILVATATPLYEHIVVRTAVFTYVVIFVGSALTMLYLRTQETTSRFEEGRRSFLALVGGLAAFFTLFEYLPYLGVDLPPVGTLLTLIFLYMLSQSVVRHRLIDLYELAGRLAVLTTLSFFLAGILWVLVFFAGGRYFLQAVVASLVVLVLFDPVRSKVSQKIAQLLFRERYAFERVITSLRAELAHVLEGHELAHVLIEGLEQTRRVTHAGVYLADDAQHGYDLAGHVGPAPLARIEIAPARPLLDRLVEDDAVVLENLERQLEEHRASGADREAETLFEITQTLAAMNASVCLAIRAEDGSLYGVLALRDERMVDAYSPEEVQLLIGLAAQTATTIENSRLYLRLKERDRLASLGEMAAGLAHEIRNPLGAIKASAQYLTEGQEQEGEEFLGIIVEEVDRLNRVVSSFLDYARPSSGNPASVDINAVVERTAQLLRPECQVAEVTLELLLDDELPLVRIDAEQLRQIFLNLVHNAIQAFEGGGGIIRLKTTTVTTRRVRNVVISVEDNGPGISAEVVPHLFVPFVTTKDRGTGLGLAISQRIANAAGGRLQVRSQPGKGATFLLTLPVVQSTGESEAESATESPSESNASLAESIASSTPSPDKPSTPPTSTPSTVTTSR
ncbi:MAG: two-component system sensor histidine kinase HydH [Polyangiales bacterium]